MTRRLHAAGQPDSFESIESDGCRLTLTAATEADGVQARVEGTAYTGAKMSLPGWRFPVVVDLAGLTIPDTLPLLVNHENRTGSRIGVITARRQQNALAIQGEVLKQLQKLMIDLGYDLSLSGEYDQATRKALREFVGNENFEDRTDIEKGQIDAPVFEYLFENFSS